jgi:endonuclease YncB( thermonuclease family)
MPRRFVKGGTHREKGDCPMRSLLTAAIVLMALTMAAVLKGETGPLAAASAASSAPRVITGRPRVVDAGTIEMHSTRIRLYGIDAPDVTQLCQTSRGLPYRCGKRAALALADKIEGRTTSCQQKAAEGDHSIVAVCWMAAENMNAWMVLVGWAVARRPVSADYIPHEETAKKLKRGLWAGTFVMPGEWRRKSRSVQ